ncbi:MAG: SIS domain-containing protein [Candidatus Hodarchaeales archaeon]
MNLSDSEVKKLEEKQLLEFLDSYNLLIETGRQHAKDFEYSPDSILLLCKMFKDSKNGTIHITGMGRSGKVGMIFGNLLKNLGYRVSLIGKTYARPVRKNDLVIAFSGSGWTRTTALNLEDSLKNSACTAAFTSNPNSKIARLADHVILINVDKGISKKVVTSYTKRQMTGKKAPLTPLGTVFELTSMFITFALTSSLVHDSPLYGFVTGANSILHSADKTLDFLFKDGGKDLKSVVRLLETCSSVKNTSPPKVYSVGSGISNIIASITGMRLQHLRINIHNVYDWRFRNKGDVLITFSGGGETEQTLEYIRQAKASGMKTICLTSHGESSVAKESDFPLLIFGRDETKDYSQETKYKFDPVSRTGYYDPSYEYCAAVCCDAIVAQIATDLGITEDLMKEEHANIE